ncbi:hypothetical protein AB0M41_46360 [Streptomyces sp. NPDC051896]|uniref:hypothetical protein n=1 Tax=Streptomyces sp. NPDC051896 TaxID=3155416 RepID=UPI003433AFCB
MRKLTKRISLAAASVAVAGGAVLGAGGTASAAVPESAPVQHPAVSVKADHCRGDYDHRGHYYYWDDEDRCWKHHKNYRHDWNRCDHHWNRCNRDSYWYDRDSNRYDHNSNRYNR